MKTSNKIGFIHELRLIRCALYNSFRNQIFRGLNELYFAHLTYGQTLYVDKHKIFYAT